MRKIFAGFALLTFGGMTLAQDLALPEQPLQPQIRLPAIKNRWKQAGDPSVPETTIEEIERCIGQDSAMLGKTGPLRERRQTMETEQAGLDKVNAELDESAANVGKWQAALQEKASRFRSASAQLEQQRAAIEKKRNIAPRNQAAVDAFNALVKSYNAELARNNEWRTQLLREQEAQSAALRKHNAAVSEANLNVVSFNERNEAFQKQLAALASQSASYMANCAGERALRK